MNASDCYSIRNCVSTFVKTRNFKTVILKCLFQSSRLVASFSLSIEAFDCFKLMDGAHSVHQISHQYKVSQKDLFNLIEYFIDEGILEKVGNKKITLRRLKKYRRQLNFFSSFERPNRTKEAYQLALESSRVVIIGLGGIGSWLAESLTRSGVGCVVIIDNDIVEESNIPRQSLYNRTHLGSFKVNAASQSLKRINPKIKVIKVRKYISNVSSLNPFIKDADIVINCSDHPDVSVTNRIVSNCCFKESIPHILCGGYDGHLSFVGQTVIPYKSACWECYEHSGIYERGLKGFKHIAITQISKEGGTLASIAAITANIHALEAIKVLTGYTKPTMLNCKAEIDFNTLQIIRKRITRLRNCSLCHHARKD